MESYLAFWQTERVAKVQSAIHVRIGEGNKVLVFSGGNTKLLHCIWWYKKKNTEETHKDQDWNFTAAFMTICSP